MNFHPGIDLQSQVTFIVEVLHAHGFFPGLVPVPGYVAAVPGEPVGAGYINPFLITPQALGIRGKGNDRQRKIFMYNVAGCTDIARFGSLSEEAGPHD